LKCFCFEAATTESPEASKCQGFRLAESKAGAVQKLSNPSHGLEARERSKPKTKIANEK
jgi:hypothetical protein